MNLRILTRCMKCAKESCFENWLSCIFSVFYLLSYWFLCVLLGLLEIIELSVEAKVNYQWKQKARGQTLTLDLAVSLGPKISRNVFWTTLFTSENLAQRRQEPPRRIFKILPKSSHPAAFSATQSLTLAESSEGVILNPKTEIFYRSSLEDHDHAVYLRHRRHRILYH